jgi:hypothetical protein
MFYMKKKRFIDIFIAKIMQFYMRFGMPPGTGVVTQRGTRQSRCCKSRGIAERLITDFSYHY